MDVHGINTASERNAAPPSPVAQMEARRSCPAHVSLEASRARRETDGRGRKKTLFPPPPRHPRTLLTQDRDVSGGRWHSQTGDGRLYRHTHDILHTQKIITAGWNQPLLSVQLVLPSGPSRQSFRQNKSAMCHSSGKQGKSASLRNKPRQSRG